MFIEYTLADPSLILLAAGFLGAVWSGIKGIASGLLGKSADQGWGNALGGLAGSVAAPALSSLALNSANAYAQKSFIGGWQGEAQKNFNDAAFPGSTPWEQLSGSPGSGSNPSAGGVGAKSTGDYFNQQALQQRQLAQDATLKREELANQKGIAKLNYAGRTGLRVDPETAWNDSASGDGYGVGGTTPRLTRLQETQIHKLQTDMVVSLKSVGIREQELEVLKNDFSLRKTQTYFGKGFAQNVFNTGAGIAGAVYGWKYLNPRLQQIISRAVKSGAVRSGAKAAGRYTLPVAGTLLLMSDMVKAVVPLIQKKAEPRTIPKFVEDFYTRGLYNLLPLNKSKKSFDYDKMR